MDVEMKIVVLPSDKECPVLAVGKNYVALTQLLHSRFPFLLVERAAEYSGLYALERDCVLSGPQLPEGRRRASLWGLDFLVAVSDGAWVS